MAAPAITRNTIHPTMPSKFVFLSPSSTMMAMIFFFLWGLIIGYHRYRIGEHVRIRRLGLRGGDRRRAERHPDHIEYPDVRCKPSEEILDRFITARPRDLEGDRARGFHDRSR